MKKWLVFALITCMLCGLCACGGGSGSGGGGTNTNQTNQDSVAGYYALVAFEDSEGYYEMDSEEMEHLNPDELSYVIMKDDKTATVMIDLEVYQMTYNGSTFMDDEGGAIDYDFKDGKLVVYYDDELTYYYEKSDREGPSDGEQKGGEAFTEDAIASFEGDWHGWCEVNYGTGAFEEDAGLTFEIIARFVFDEDGNCQPFMAIPVDDPADDFQGLTVSYDSYGDYMYFYGEVFDTKIEEGNLADLGGFLSGTLVLEEGDDYLSVSICMCPVGATWDPAYHTPCMPDEVIENYEGLDLIDIAELYGVDLDRIPED